MINVLIIDDSPIACKGIQANIDCDKIQSACVTNSKDCLKHLASHPTDVLILDYAFPNDKNGFVQALQLRRRFPNIKILFLSTYEMPILANVLYHNGNGYMNKSSVFSYKEAITAIYNGKQYIQPDIAEYIFFDNHKQNSPTLSLREKQIYLLLMDNYNSQQIAEILHTSMSTVTRNRISLRKKIDLKSYPAMPVSSHYQKVNTVKNPVLLGA